ncbi:MAG: amidohydrolase family protein [Prevotellaceae bacterium]|jgi:cytosine/adenosine deaminase-related metal-dependent hydrolase|nr:amidohydrolase family protein [Prevotellaceae bacterium]
MRKISADYIFPVHTQPIKNGALTIADDGTISDISTFSENLETSADIEFYDGIICPGFINVHCHLELSHLKNSIPMHTGIIGFIKEISKRSNITDLSEQIQSAKFYDDFMYRQGIVAVGDVSNKDWTFELKKESKIFYHTFVESFSRDESETDKILQKNQDIVDCGKRLGLSVSPTLHAPYSMCDGLFSELKIRAEKYEILSYHNQETQAENEYFENNSGDFLKFYNEFAMPDNPLPMGKTSIHRLLDNVDGNTKILLVHNTFTSENDCDFAMSVSKNITWALCPKSNLYIENQLPPVEMFRRKNAKIAIGTDSLSSNTNLSMIEEMLAISENFDNIDIDELLKWATVNGAKALGIDKNFGTFERGKKPGIVLIDNIDMRKMMLTKDSHSKIL